MVYVVGCSACCFFAISKSVGLNSCLIGRHTPFYKFYTFNCGVSLASYNMVRWRILKSLLSGLNFDDCWNPLLYLSLSVGPYIFLWQSYTISLFKLFLWQVCSVLLYLIQLHKAIDFYSMTWYSVPSFFGKVCLELFSNTWRMYVLSVKVLVRL